MAFEKVSDILKEADKHNTSVLSFNCIDYNTVYAVIKAAEITKKPVLAMMYPEHMYKNNYITPKAFAEMVKSLAKNISVPIGIHLDHCSDYHYIVSAIKDGFTSVMYDGSMLPLDKNIANTKKVVETAHILGADVEAELGHVGTATVTDHFKKDLYTSVEDAKQFCEETGVDSLAVAVGSAHGFYTVAPTLNLKRLEEINAVTNTPLVMHGGSGIPLDQVAEAFTKGINKFNVGTEFFHLYHTTMLDFAKNNEDFFSFPLIVQESLIKYLVEKLKLCRM